jgi:hypothetical protein
VQRAVELLRGQVRGAVALRRELSALSGISEVKHMLAAYFREQDHVLKVRSSLQLLHRLSFAVGADGTPAAGSLRLRSAVEDLRLDDAMHPIAELEVWHDCCSGQVELPVALLEEMRVLFSPGSAASRVGAPGAGREEVLAAARVAMNRWRAFMNTEASPAQGRVCRVVLRSYRLLWEANGGG